MRDSPCPPAGPCPPQCPLAARFCDRIDGVRMTRVVSLHALRSTVPVLRLLVVLAAGSTIGAEPKPAVAPDHAERMAKGRDLFTRQIRPILLESCFKCHGGEKTRAGLDLGSRETLVKGGEN